MKPEIPTEKINELKDTFKTSVKVLKLVWNVDKLMFLGSVVTFAIPAITPFINIYIYKLVIDLVIETINSGVFNPNQFYPLIAFRIGSSFAQDLSFSTQQYINRLLWTKIPIEMDQIFLKKLSTLDINYFENDKFRDLLEKARDSYVARPQQLVQGIFFSFQSLIQITIAFVTLIKLNWFFIILISVGLIPDFFIQASRSKMAWGVWSEHSPFRKRYRYLTRLLEGHREVKELRIFKLATVLLKEINSIQHKFYKDNKKILKKSYTATVIYDIFWTVIIIGIELYVILQALGKKLTVGDINFYTGVVFNFQNGLGGLFRNLNSVFENSLYVKNIFDILDVEPIIKISENPIKLNLKKPPVIEFKDVTFAYPDTKQNILKNFSITINPGEKVAFVGENGAGKSTIIKLLARFYDVTEGQILINGVDIKELDLSHWYSHLGVLFQDFNRYEHTVKENIYFGNVDQDLDMQKIMEAASSSGAASMISKYDNKYDQILGKMFENGIEPSGGQWQKIALARAFFRNAPVLILDEPTASIDAKAESEIFNRVEKLSKDKTVIIISHRFSTVRNADKIFVIENGKIVEEGGHKSLMKENGQYATLFKLQAKGYQ